MKLSECSLSYLGIACGVPQGLVLGPKHFFLYIDFIFIKSVLFVNDRSFVLGLLRIINLDICKL